MVDSLVTQYDERGTILRSFLPMSQFGSDARLVQQASSIGVASFGLDATRVWAFLPGSGKLATIDKASGLAAVQDIGSPAPLAKEVAQDKSATAAVYKAVLPPAGGLLAEVWLQTRSSGKNNLYQWEPPVTAFPTFPLQYPGS